MTHSLPLPVLSHRLHTVEPGSRMHLTLLFRHFKQAADLEASLPVPGLLDSVALIARSDHDRTPDAWRSCIGHIQSYSTRCLGLRAQALSPTCTRVRRKEVKKKRRRVGSEVNTKSSCYAPSDWSARDHAFSASKGPVQVIGVGTLWSRLQHQISYVPGRAPC